MAFGGAAAGGAQERGGRFLLRKKGVLRGRQRGLTYAALDIFDQKGEGTIFTLYIDEYDIYDLYIDDIAISGKSF